MRKQFRRSRPGRRQPVDPTSRRGLQPTARQLARDAGRVTRHAAINRASQAQQPRPSRASEPGSGTRFSRTRIAVSNDCKENRQCCCRSAGVTGTRTTEKGPPCGGPSAWREPDQTRAGSGALATTRSADASRPRPSSASDAGSAPGTRRSGSPCRTRVHGNQHFDRRDVREIEACITRETRQRDRLQLAPLSRSPSPPKVLSDPETILPSLL